MRFVIAAPVMVAEVIIPILTLAVLVLELVILDPNMIALVIIPVFMLTSLEYTVVAFKLLTTAELIEAVVIIPELILA